MGGELVYNHADYRLMSKRALKGLLEFDEVNIFLRGMVPMVGYQSDIVTYERAERFAGESKYPLKKMLSFAFEGITSLSVKPIKMIFNVGILICIISVLAADKRILKDPAPFIALHALDASSVNVVARVWVNSADYWGVYFDINKAIYATFNEKGINFPFPQLTVHQGN